MPDLNFKVERAEPVSYAASPTLQFRLNIANNRDSQTIIHAVALRCQIRIEPARRKYAPAEREKLLDLYGQPERWGQTLQTMLWENTSIVVPPFAGETTAELPVHCSSDFNLAAAKYFYALENGEAPLCLLFSGTIFYVGKDGALQVEQISWEKEAGFRLPISVWKQMMEMYYPGSAWLILQRSVFDRLALYKSCNCLPTWEAALDRLMQVSEAEVET